MRRLSIAVFSTSGARFVILLLTWVQDHEQRRMRQPFTIENLTLNVGMGSDDRLAKLLRAFHAVE